MSDTAKVISMLALFALVVAAAVSGLPPVPTVVLAICGGLLLNGFERAAAKRDLWPD